MSCPVSGTHHSWVKLGLDVVNDRLVWARRCSWCKAERNVGYQQAPFKRELIRIRRSA